MSTYYVKNPRTGKNDYCFIPSTEQDVNNICIQLRYHQNRWCQRSIQQRCDILMCWYDALKQMKHEIIHALSIDTGRYFLSQIEYEHSLQRIQYWCELAPKLITSQQAYNSVFSSSVQINQQRVPYPLVGIISPWNFPLTLSLIDTIPALLSGCSVLLKPSEITPRFIEPVRNSLKKIPELSNVFSIAMGPSHVGKHVVNNADFVCFTGSVTTGKKIAQQTANQMIPASLELGGKDPAIVLPCADLEKAADAIVRSAFTATGQACQSIERVYVAEQIYPSFLDKIITRTNGVKLNYPNIHKGHIGPFIYDKQAHKVSEQFIDAVNKGAIIHTGGKVEKLGGGYWCHPTVMGNTNHTMKIMTEETFGPIIPAMSYKNIEQAIALANDTKYGLSAAVFSKNSDKALDVAKQLHAGAISINDSSLTSVIHDAEKNAFKYSGLGPSRMGEQGILRFFRNKALLLQQAQPLNINQLSENPPS